jgi:type IV secretory pathway VirD2 relaxase
MVTAVQSSQEVAAKQIQANVRWQQRNSSALRRVEYDKERYCRERDEEIKLTKVWNSLTKGLTEFGQTLSKKASEITIILQVLFIIHTQD